MPEKEKIPPWGRNSIESFANISEVVARAYSLAKIAHAGHARLTGEPSFEGHLVPVANDLLQDGVFDETLLAAALLHDAVEDTDLKLEDIESELGSDVAQIVDVVTGLKSEDSSNGGRINEEVLDKAAVVKIASAFTTDPRGPIVKIYDRSDNMRSLNVFLEKKRRMKAMETLNVYAEMARALGLWRKKVELEDLAFAHIAPQAYELSELELGQDPRTQEEFIQTYTRLLTEVLEENSITASVESVINGLYTLYKKREEELIKGKARLSGFREINDVVSFRVIVNNEPDCYRTLEYISKLFSEDSRGNWGLYDPHEIDNYLNMPQANGYSALHVTVHTEKGPIEIAITTFDKEEINNLGVLAHIKNQRYDKVKDYALLVLFDEHGHTSFVRESARVIDAVYALFPQSAPRIDSVNINGENYPLTDFVPNAATLSPVFSIDPRRSPKSSLTKIAQTETRARINNQLLLAEKDRLIKVGLSIMQDILSPRGFLHFNDLPPNIKIRLLHETEVYDIAELLIHLALSREEQSNTTQALDELGVTKEALNSTSLILRGKDKKGIMGFVGDEISDHNGTVRAQELKVDGDTFEWRLAISGLANSRLAEEELLKNLKKSGYFEDIIIV